MACTGTAAGATDTAGNATDAVGGTAATSAVVIAGAMDMGTIAIGDWVTTAPEGNFSPDTMSTISCRMAMPHCTAIDRHQA